MQILDFINVVYYVENVVFFLQILARIAAKLSGTGLGGVSKFSKNVITLVYVRVRSLAPQNREITK